MSQDLVEKPVLSVSTIQLTPRSAPGRSLSLVERATSPVPSPAPAHSPSSDLVRRHNTLTTSSSRLVRNERSRVRVALQDVGLTREDQEFYVPDSPVNDIPGVPWSDIGHGSPRLASDATTPTALNPLPAQAKRSSFVVVRAGKGDVLNERSSPAGPIGHIPSHSGHSSGLGRKLTPPRTMLNQRKNSLQTFMEHESETNDDWESRLQAEQNREREQYKSPHPPSLSESPTTFNYSSSWANNPNSLSDESNPLRRHQSLTFLSEGRSTPSNTWETDSYQKSPSFADSRGGGRPPSLSLSESPNQRSLSHTNSLTSTHYHQHLPVSNPLNSRRAPRTPLSPVGGFDKSPWSPTPEETLSMTGVVNTPPNLIAPSSSLRRGGVGGGSTSSHGSQSSHISRLTHELSSLDMNDHPSSPSFYSTANSKSESYNQLEDVNRPALNKRLPPLMTNPEVLANGSQTRRQPPMSASPYVLPIGHSTMPMSTTEYSRPTFTAAPGVGNTDWASKKNQLVGYGDNQGDIWPPANFGIELALQQQAQIQMLQSQMHQAIQVMNLMKAQGQIPANFNGDTLLQNSNEHQSQQQYVAESPIDIGHLIKEKGYNPENFDITPASARFFVIKSYTEVDVHKSLKYEIWASTDLGNKRLDRAFRESAEKGPIYLFFSVNGSGHFAGMAQMLTPVDYSMTSTVWASDKWKGIMNLRWIFIKDVPLSALRHIRLTNTAENKPVTSSRDTQEVPYLAGLEVLKIISTYNSRTSLLQQFQWFEAQEKSGQTNGPPLPIHYPSRANIHSQQGDNSERRQPPLNQYAQGRRYGSNTPNAY